MGILFVDMIIFCLTGIGRKDNQEILTRRAATMWLCRRKMHVKIGKNYRLKMTEYYTAEKNKGYCERSEH